MAQGDLEPQLPVPISAVGSKYLLFDIQAITWLRKHHHICGVFIGSLPQNPSQNVFMGLPMEIMPEEAQLLIELELGYILDDARSHDAALAKANHARQVKYAREVEEQAANIAMEKAQQSEKDRKAALKKNKAKKSRRDSSSVVSDGQDRDGAPPEETHPSDLLFAPPEDQDPPAPKPSTSTRHTSSAPNSISTVDLTVTPTTSISLLPSDLPSSPTTRDCQTLLPGLAQSTYNLYRHLHLFQTSSKSSNYYMTPGLRFGCQFCIYPGDPLRFHSHFLSVGIDWEEEIDLMDIVGGGRLGTGVKKGYLLGAKDPNKDEMRTFSIEWAAM